MTLVDPVSMVMSQAIVTLVEVRACHFCADAEDALTEIAQEYPFRVDRLDLRSTEGQDLMQQHRAAMNPLVLLNGVYVSSGRLPRGKLRALLAAHDGVRAVPD